MHTCFRCGTEFEGNYCPECGTRWQEEKTCPSCGATLGGGTKYCSHCGYSFQQSAAEQPAKAVHRTVNSDKLYLFLHLLPAILLGLFSLLLFAFLAAPALQASVSGLGSASDNGYQIISDPIASDLHGCYIAFAVIGCIAIIFSSFMLITLHKNLAVKLHPVLSVGLTFYLIFLIIASVAISKANNLDGGLGVFSAGACPILILVFSLLFALGTVGAMIGKNYVQAGSSSQPAPSNWKNKKFFLWVKEHKKISVLITLASAAIITLCCCIPTFILMDKNGTYYRSYNGEIMEQEYISLDNGTWKDSTGASGKYTVSGNNITLTLNGNSNGTVLEGTVSNGVLKIEANGTKLVYRTENHQHAFSEWEEEYAATCEKDGLQFRECDCGKTETKVIRATGHSYGDWTVTSNPTCTEEGIREKKCSVCGNVQPEAIPAMGHIYNTDNVCNTCGFVLEYTQGLTIQIGEQSCTLVNIGTASGDIIIPYYYEGIPVTAIGDHAFICTSLTSVTIPDSVTVIGKRAFEQCRNLTSVTIGSGVTTIGEFAFSACSGLTSITIPDSVTSIGDWAFEWCDGLTSITLPNSVTSIGGYAFSGCTNLTSVTIPDSVKIDTGAFSGCTNLTSVIIPDNVTSIGSWAFSGCTNLTSVIIPDSVTSIGQETFKDCSGLTSITYNGTKTQWNKIIMYSNWNKNTGNYTIHCTDGDIEK